MSLLVNVHKHCSKQTVMTLQTFLALNTFAVFSYIKQLHFAKKRLGVKNCLANTFSPDQFIANIWHRAWKMFLSKVLSSSTNFSTRKKMHDMQFASSTPLLVSQMPSSICHQNDTWGQKLNWKGQMGLYACAFPWQISINPWHSPYRCISLTHLPYKVG